MARSRKPASLKQGHSESKEQLKRREEIEKQLMGNADDVKSIPEYLTEEEKIYYKWLTEELEISNLICNLENGILIQKMDRFGNLEDKENPCIKVKLNYQTKYASLCNQLGLSPAARSALAGKQLEMKQEETDPLLQILKGGL